MPSNKPRITVYTDSETNEKLAFIAKMENRSASNYAEYLIKKEIKAYEEEHGEIPIKGEIKIEKIARILPGARLGEEYADKYIEKKRKEKRENDSDN